jgi:hypothetical protein
MAEWTFDLAVLIQSMSLSLHGRLAGRLSEALLGLLFARDGFTYSRWLVALGITEKIAVYYYFLGSLGRVVRSVAVNLLRSIAEKVFPGSMIRMAIDDSPTKRYGSKVEGAGIHHNPSPGPADAQFLYGHVWVVLALLGQHPLWNTIAFPVLSLMYLRQVSWAKLAPWDRKNHPFRTKLQLAAELVEWAARWLKYLGKTMVVVVDGGYAKREFLRRAVAAGVIVVGRLRKDAALFERPPAPKAGTRRRGRPRLYGAKRLSLAKRAGAKSGWQKVTVNVYGKTVVKKIKTFLATWKPAAGVIRVVIIQESSLCLPLFCTDPALTVESMIESYAARASIEQGFKDLKQVHGWGKPQLRNVWANIAAANLACWLHSLIELWAWEKPAEQLIDRSHRPWDNQDRRPSHADRKSALRQTIQQKQFQVIYASKAITPKIRNAIKHLLQLGI